MRKERSRSSSERGAVIIQVAVCLLFLLAFSAFVVDYGIMWASRGQIQTSADAGALAGAIALAYDGLTDVDLVAAKADAQRKARATAQQNGVWAQQPDVQLSDVTFPACPPGSPGVPDTCVKVDAFRNQLRGNPLGMLFGNLVGVNNQGVRATATAQIAGADTTECLRPWAIIDRWDEFSPKQYVSQGEYNDPEFGPDQTFDLYSDGKGNKPPPEADFYQAPTKTEQGTGYKISDHGKQFAVKTDSNESATVSPGWFRAIRIPRLDGQSGADVYGANIRGCGGLPASYASPETVCPNVIGNDDAAYWAARGCFGTEPGNKVGPTRDAVAELIARDGGASWSGGENGEIVGSTFNPPTSSPRVVPLGVLDINTFLQSDPTGANAVVKLVNIYGFFIEGMGDVDEATGMMTPNPNGKSVIGRLLTIPGSGVTKVSSNATFLRTIILVR